MTGVDGPFHVLLLASRLFTGILKLAILQVDLNTQDSDLPFLLCASLGGEIIPGDGARGAGGGGGPCPAALTLPGWEFNYSGAG